MDSNCWRVVVVLGLLAVCSSTFADESGGSAQDIGTIERRGRQIAEYERAVTTAIDLLSATKPDYVHSGLTAAVKKEDTWMVYVGDLSEDGSAWVPAHSYSCPDTLFEEMKAVKDSKVAGTEILQLAKAIQLSLTKVDAKWPQYLISAFLEGDGSATVYIVPRSEKKDIALLGGDFKLSISLDGSKILQNSQLHGGTLEVPLRAPEGKTRAAAFHTHASANLPTETDVALVLSNPELAPHFVVGSKWISRINADGTVSIFGLAGDAKAWKQGKP
jgi:hypothetical protein